MVNPHPQRSTTKGSPRWPVLARVRKIHQLCVLVELPSCGSTQHSFDLSRDAPDASPAPTWEEPICSGKKMADELYT